ncbi:MAG: hypothetical protein ACUVSK_07270 [Desulfotomaculales bacterium]
MRIKSVQIRDPEKARRVVCSLRSLACAWADLPVLRPKEFWPYRPPGLPQQAKLHLLILHPKKGARELEGWDLARAAVDILEGRHGATLDWACGFRASGAVWLLLKPWAADAATGRRKWFYVDAGDLAALREKLSLTRPRGNARKRERPRERER